MLVRPPQDSPAYVSSDLKGNGEEGMRDGNFFKVGSWGGFKVGEDFVMSYLVCVGEK